MRARALATREIFPRKEDFFTRLACSRPMTTFFHEEDTFSSTATSTQRCIGRDRRRGRWKRQVECRYYVELEGAEPERGMKLLPRETAEVPSFPSSLSPLFTSLGIPFHDLSLFTLSRRGVGWG